MAFDLYNARAGALKKVEASPSSSFLSVDGLDGMLKGGRMLGTSFRLDRGQDVQYLKTLSSAYYLYAFGEAPGKILIGGLLFFAGCDDNNSQIIADINGYYNQHNAYDGGAVMVTAGGAAFRCLLTNLSVSADMNPYNYATFSLGFMMLPKV